MDIRNITLRSIMPITHSVTQNGKADSKHCHIRQRLHRHRIRGRERDRMSMGEGKKAYMAYTICPWTYFVK